VICGRYDVTQNGVEINYKEPEYRHVNGHDLPVNRSDGGLVLIDYEDLKKTGYLEVAYHPAFSWLYSLEIFQHT